MLLQNYLKVCPDFRLSPVNGGGWIFTGDSIYSPFIEPCKNTDPAHESEQLIFCYCLLHRDGHILSDLLLGAKDSLTNDHLCLVLSFEVY